MGQVGAALGKQHLGTISATSHHVGEQNQEDAKS